MVLVATSSRKDLGAQMRRMTLPQDQYYNSVADDMDSIDPPLEQVENDAEMMK